MMFRSKRPRDSAATTSNGNQPIDSAAAANSNSNQPRGSAPTSNCNQLRGSAAAASTSNQPQPRGYTSTSNSNSNSSDQVMENNDSTFVETETQVAMENEARGNNEGSRRRGRRKRNYIPANANSTNEEPRDWSDDVSFDASEDVRAIDSEGKIEIWSGSIQPHDVWHMRGGFRFEVPFNRYYQPIRKGGAVLVKFISDIAKHTELCPIDVENWRKVTKQVQADIVELIRGKFIIPDGKIYNDAMIKHVGKHRRQWKFELKARFFNPSVRTRQEIENNQPGGFTRTIWLKLVDYWFSSKSKKYAANGKEARAMLGHLHTNGSTSFATSRDEFEETHGREPRGLEFFDITHKSKEGVYPDNTNTQEFINVAKAKIDENVASSTKPRIEIEEDVFDELMYDKDKSSQKPIGYGFGVQRNDVMGVHALLRKRGISSEMGNNGDQNLQVKFARHKKHTTSTIKKLVTSISDLLGAVQSGRISPEMLAATNSTLRSINDQDMEDLNEEPEDGDDLNHANST